MTLLFTSLELEFKEFTNINVSIDIFVDFMQLDCVGGSAGCYRYRPKVVQCLNAGFDGYDVQVS